MTNSFSAAQDGLGTRDEFDEKARRSWQDLLERDDRTSPVEYPDVALIITFDQFASALRAERDAERAACEAIARSYGSDQFAEDCHRIADAIAARRKP